MTEKIKRERDELYGYVNGLLGLLQMVRGRDDIPQEVKEILRTNHRVADAAAYLTQIAQPEERDRYKRMQKEMREKYHSTSRIKSIAEK